MLKEVDKSLMKKSKEISTFQSEILFDYYVNYFNSLSSTNLDKEFNRDLSIMTNSLRKLPEKERGLFVNYIAKLIEAYIESKVEKELTKSFHLFF